MNRSWSILLAGLLSLSAGFLQAQSVFTVTTSAGDQSANSLGWAVTSLNAAGDGAISIDNGSANVTLTQPLPVLGSSNVTLQGDPLNLFGQNSAQSQFLVQGALNQQDHFFFQDTGTSGSGLDMSVTAGSWVQNGSYFTNLWAGSVTDTTLSGGSGFTAGDGGNNGVTIGFLTVNNGWVIKGGAGGAVTDTSGSNDMGGNGGNAYLTGTSLVMAGSIFQVLGGNGGSVTDLGSGTGHQGGDGGSASVSYGFVNSGPFGNFYVQAGDGGSALTAGNGGAATALVGTLGLTQGFNVLGGQGGNGPSLSGNGGSAFASIGSFIGTGGSNLKIAGGNGGGAVNSAGQGGNATLAGGSITINGPGSSFQVLGGNGGNLAPLASGPGGDGGNGGSASVSLTDLEILSASTFKVLGGAGGSGSSGAGIGDGGAGGDTTFHLGTLAVGTNTILSLSSGFGGVGGTANSGGTGGAGGNGGDLSVTLGSLALGTGSNLNLTGGTGGGGGAVASGGTGGDGGSGGNVTLSVGSVTLASGNVLNISGGAGGSGGLAGTSGSAGANGQAFATIGNLDGSGSVNMGGSAVLQISQGLFTGTLTGSENLQKTSGATLVLGGANSYGGGTSVLAGTLAVDTGGTLGVGIVQVGSGSLLTYLNSANASATTIVNNAGASLVFANSSSAGTASVTNNSILAFTGTSTAGSAQVVDAAGATVLFTGSASGGTAAFNLLSSGTQGILNIGGATGTVTIGSLTGTGDVLLGTGTLAIGSNGQSTTFAGLFQQLGSVAKVGTGNLVLTAASTFTGGTSILGGTLSLGSANALGGGNVYNAAQLRTTGGPLTVQLGADYTQTASGTLNMGLGGSGISSFDKMTVIGDMSLDGTLSLFSYGGLTAAPIGNAVLLLASGGTVSGEFQDVVENLSAGIRLLPIYLSNAVELLSINPSFRTAALTPNQAAIGEDLDQVVFKPQLNGLMSFLGTLADPDLRTALTELSPEDLVSLYSIGFQGAAARFDAVSHRLEQLRQDVDGTLWLPGFSWNGETLFAANLPATRERALAGKNREEWSGFVAANGGLYQVDADANASGYKTTSFGLTAAGLDIRLSREAAAGFLLSYQHGDVTFGSGGTLADDEVQGGVYGMVYSEGFYAEGLAEGGLHNYRTKRTGYNGIATGTPQGTQFDGALELGYAIDMKQVHLGPYGALQYTLVQVNAFSESGSQAPLTYPSQSNDSLLGQAGLQASGDLKLAGGAVLTPGIKVGYEHEFDYQGGTFQAGMGTGDVFTVAGPVVGKDGFLASAGADLTVHKDLRFFADYQGQFGRAGLSSHQVDLGSRIGF
ncbi:MAG TPA: autotransporter domain-containing protein [bacterium]|nr:autotransporter domain-containing protein [bacterium]